MGVLLYENFGKSAFVNSLLSCVKVYFKPNKSVSNKSKMYTKRLVDCGV